MIYTPIRKQ